jgi:predicted dehydrogenase
MTRKTNRRDFLKQSTLAGVGFWAAGGVALAKSKAANEKLNVAIIGAGGQGGGNLKAIAGLGENIVALCDVDEQRAKEAFEKFTKAEKFNDFRKMLEKRKDIDAVVVSTPDHQHAVAGVMAMKMGRHLYCEKPLTHDVYEARVMRETAKKYNVATQMGNMGTASSGFREGVEIIQSGALGPIEEVHVWSNRPIWPQGVDRPKDTPPVPKTLSWDLWLGTAPDRPYAVYPPNEKGERKPAYHPFAWRGWWDFGTGALGDMACHTVNLPFMGLKLAYPTSIEAETSGTNGDSYPKWSTIHFQFPARGELPAVKLTWYDGGKKPAADILDKYLKGRKIDGSGCLLIGEKGALYSRSDYGEDHLLLPQEEFAGHKPPTPTLPRSPGHHKEWILACKGGKPAMANFDYAALLTEAILLGNLAMRVGKKVEWDGENMKSTNCPEAEQFVRRQYRGGWSL